VPLTDADRAPWLAAMRSAILQWNAARENAVLACSALKRSYRTDQVELVVPSFTPPQDWLVELDNLIAHSRAVRESSRLVQNQSGQLRRESAQVREKSREERARSRREAARNAATRLLGQPEEDSNSNPK